MDIKNLRISVTQRCNLLCPYCHHEGQVTSSAEPSLEQIENVICNAKQVGVEQIKLTGGEPLLRKDILDIVRLIKSYGFSDISMVTNGFRLKTLADQLKEAGLNRVNIGCDSLLMRDTKEYKTKQSAIDGLIAAKKAGLVPIKLNMVVLKGVNETEIPAMIAFAREHGAILQLIELIETEKEYFDTHFFSLAGVEADFADQAVRVKSQTLHGRKQYDLGGVWVEVVRPSGREFCKNCKRLRMTSDGKVKACIRMNDNLIDFKNKDSLLKAVKVKKELIGGMS